MWYRLFRSCALMVLWLMQQNPVTAQIFRCEDEAATDSAISFISSHYSYTGREWQNACDSLLAVCPALDWVWQMKAMPYIKLGDWHSCFSNLAHAVALNPARWLPYQAFLKCIFAKDYKGALAEFNSCDTLRTGSGVMDHSFDFYKGLCCLGMKDYRGTRFYLGRDISVQEQARGKENVHYVSLFYWGLYHYLIKNYTVAEQHFRRCLKVYPQYPEPLYYLGLTLNSLKRKAEAAACFTKAKESLNAGYNSNEDQEFYVNYPFAIAMREVEEQLAGSK